MPQRIVRGETEPRGVPRSGGEKNFLEFMYPNVGLRLPHIRTTCSFAIMYILLYNLGGNAIAFALQAVKASGRYETGAVPPRGAVLGIALGVLTFIILLHAISRTGGILINNLFAIVKVALLLTMFALGVAKAAGAFGGSGAAPRNNFTRDVWTAPRPDVSSWSNSILLAAFAMSGWKQPFYMLAEIKSPQKVLPKYTIIGWAILAALYMLLNIAYLLVVDKAKILPQGLGELAGKVDMATLFFDELFFDDEDKAARAMAGLVAFSIFGNLWVTTFTAVRIKQEIAKEGILPKSLYLAASYTTPFGMFQKWFSKRPLDEHEVDKAPTLAFSLHWFSSVLLVAVMAPLADTRQSYLILTSLYSYAVNTLIGFWVSVGLIIIKMRKSKWHWQERRRYRPWMSPAHVVLYTIFTAFILVAAFVPPSEGSPYREQYTNVPYFIVPIIGLTAPFWGVLGYWGLQIYEWKIGRLLTISREAYWMPDPDCPSEYVQQAEIIDLTWSIAPRDGMSEGFELQKDRSNASSDSSPLRHRDVLHAGFEDAALENGGGAAQSRQTRTINRRRLSDSFDP
jgi:amino acid transporter